ncbi:MAG: hypothetical protein DRH70_09730 [Candidatus Coatesbacteria bacterium]|nr:MAG: hypothetical protein DRH70_09730 [Candidatus Coatesbacteria bacterium]
MRVCSATHQGFVSRQLDLATTLIALATAFALALMGRRFVRAMKVIMLKDFHASKMEAMGPVPTLIALATASVKSTMSKLLVDVMRVIMPRSFPVSKKPK